MLIFEQLSKQLWGLHIRETFRYSRLDREHYIHQLSVTSRPVPMLYSCSFVCLLFFFSFFLVLYQRQLIDTQ